MPRRAAVVVQAERRQARSARSTRSSPSRQGHAGTTGMPTASARFARCAPTRVPTLARCRWSPPAGLGAEIGTHSRGRALDLFRQAGPVPRWFIGDARPAQLARDNGLSISTALRRAKEAGLSHLDLDGTVIPSTHPTNASAGTSSAPVPRATTRTPLHIRINPAATRNDLGAAILFPFGVPVIFESETTEYTMDVISDSAMTALSSITQRALVFSGSKRYRYRASAAE